MWCFLHLEYHFELLGLIICQVKLRISVSSNVIGFEQAKNQLYSRGFHVKYFTRNHYKGLKEKKALLNCFVECLTDEKR